MSHSESNLLEYFRTGHTLSLDRHTNDSKPMLHARSALLLGVKSPSLPALSYDMSKELAEEDKFRRSLHSNIISTCPSAFHRQRRDDYPSSMVRHNKVVKDLLCDMHKDKDTSDIDKNKSMKYTFSIKRESDLKEKLEHEEKMFNSLHPLEDFVRPENPVSPRQTGYEHGHIRSLFKLDTYGPTSSRLNTGDRESGRLPLPNVDRYVRVSPTHKLTLRSDVWSSNSSRTSTSQSTRSSFLSSTGGESIRDKPSSSMRSLFHSSSRIQTPHDLTIPPSLRGAEGKLEQRITKEDRIMLDPLIRRKHWHQTYVERVKTAKDQETYNRKVKDYKKQQLDIASQERRKIKEFEKHLVLAKFES